MQFLDFCVKFGKKRQSLENVCKAAENKLNIGLSSLCVNASRRSSLVSATKIIIIIIIIRGIMKIACYFLFSTVLNKLFHITYIYIYSTKR